MCLADANDLLAHARFWIRPALKKPASAPPSMRARGRWIGISGSAIRSILCMIRPRAA
jgi:hypothetical protein